MRAEIVSVGTELLLGQIVDTNAAHLSKALSDLGIGVYRRTTVGDNHDRLFRALKAALAENDIVITIGGLGPTLDDITRDVLAEAMGDTLRYDEEIAKHLRAFFRTRNIPMPDSILRQAYVPTHGRPLPNPNGTAPGLIFELGGKIGIALPGPPSEFLPMLQNHVIPYLRTKTGGQTIRSRVLRICGMGESLVQERIRDLMAQENPTVAPYAKTGEVHVRVTAYAESIDAAEAMMAPVVAEIQARLGDHVYAFDEEPLHSAVVRLLTSHRLTLAIAESCTGGLLSARITEVPGSSKVFLGGAVAYSNEAKTDLVAVPAEMIAEHGAVSPQVAEAMASGARKRFGADYGIGITGIAGPEGGTPEKPVGLVYIAVADAKRVEAERNVFIGSRQDIRNRAAQFALVMLRDRVLKHTTEAMTDG
ncbi:MAG TPA: competence/damage-inducible protein A [Chthonomonadales bacterium]|nr:competence/damage-inducible protein A [Chthonomonadales bacterium]